MTTTSVMTMGIMEGSANEGIRVYFLGLRNSSTEIWAQEERPDSAPCAGVRSTGSVEQSVRSSGSNEQIVARDVVWPKHFTRAPQRRGVPRGAVLTHG